MLDADILKALFGRAMRAELAIWILGQNPVFSQKDAVDANGGYGQATAVRQELQRLIELEMIASSPVQERGNYFQRLESPWWRVFEAAAEVTGDQRELR